MAATQAYHNWVAAGEPYQLAEWMNDVVETMEGRGYIVYHYPDNAHLTTSQPQDHTPFSFTGWPIDSPFGWAFGVDIMPKPGNDARSLAPLARQIIADKDAGHPALAGLKYINWTDEQGNVWQTSWKPSKATRSNTDKGHIHLSGRSDSAHWRAVGYDPIARLAGTVGITLGERMFLSRDAAGKIYKSDDNHLWRALVADSASDPRLNNLAFLVNVAKMVTIRTPEKPMGEVAEINLPSGRLHVWKSSSNEFGRLVDTPTPSTPLTPEQITALTESITRGVIAGLNPATASEREAVASVVAAKVLETALSATDVKAVFSDVLLHGAAPK